MMQKKDRGKFTIRLNTSDPAHEKVICLLENRRPHIKAQLIVDALLYYAEHHAAGENTVIENKSPP